MALEYYLHTDCPLQQGGKPQDFTWKAKVKGMLEMLEEHRGQLEQSGKKFEQVEVTLPFTIKTGLGGRKNVVTIAELQNVWDKTRQKAESVCPSCPVNILESSLGCYGAITYPISRAGEEWLMQQFDPPEGEDAYIPHHLASSGVTGAQLEAQRPPRAQPGAEAAAPGSIWESSEAIRKRLTTTGPEYSSSQILEYILGCQPIIHPATLFGLCVDFQAVDASDADLGSIQASMAMEAMLGEQALAGDSGQSWKREATERTSFVLEVYEEDDQTIGSFKGFFHACWIAFCSDASLVIDG